MKMREGQTETIGSVVLDYSWYPEQDFYCDGAVEDELLEIVKTVPEERYPEVIREKRSWEVLYHLSDLRENIVEWLPLDKSMKVLEVGSGCGAITGSLSRRAGSVTCVDLSKKRSLINAYRHKDCDNVRICVGNFTDIEPGLPSDYDCICLIGVFEYGQSYIGGQTPFHDFYRILKKHVKAGGRIVIAIENKLGLKYWAGCREDHLGTFFSGLEDYPEGGVVRTFSRGGLERILQECRETDYHFYYPYPDYKFMTMLYSDRYLPKIGELSNNLRNLDRDRMLLFDEKKVFDTLIRENLFPLYSNSYLVVTGPEMETAYSRFSNDRARHLCIRTDIGEDGNGEKFVRKMAANPEAAAHIERLFDNYEALSACFAGSFLSANRLVRERTAEGLPCARLEYLEDAVTLEELLDDCLQREDAQGFEALFDRYLSALRLQEGLERKDLDLIFCNICVQGDRWTVIDYEWTVEELSAEDLARRALFCYVLENTARKKSPILQKVLARMGMDEDAMASFWEREQAFQRRVMTEADGQRRTALTDMRHLIGHQAVPAAEFFARSQRKRVQIFEDFGGGYCPEHSYYLHGAYEADDLITAEVTCRVGTTGIRLDPAEVPCLVCIREVYIGGRRLTPEQRSAAVSTNGEALGESLLFDTGDPNISVRLDVLGEQVTEETGEKTLRLEAEIVWLSERMLNGLRAKTTRRKKLWFQR